MDCVGVLLVAEFVGGWVGGLDFFEGDDFAFAAVGVWDDADAVCFFQRTGLCNHVSLQQTIPNNITRYKEEREGKSARK